MSENTKVKTNIDRRNFLKLGTGAVGAAVLLNPVTKALGAACGLTPKQTAGPFYPGETLFKPEHDLTLLPGHTVRATGPVVYIKGRILDQNCQPIQNANVEIWQACASGKYNNPNDPNPAPLDPHFRYWAEAFTDNQGEYWFKTIIPGAYPADATWTRPPHIHVRVTRLGYRELVTQMYFKGPHFSPEIQALNDSDLILQQIPAGQRDSVVVEFLPSTPDLEPNTLTGIFDMTLRSVR